MHADITQENKLTQSNLNTVSEPMAVRCSQIW